MKLAVYVLMHTSRQWLVLAIAADFVFEHSDVITA